MFEDTKSILRNGTNVNSSEGGMFAAALSILKKGPQLANQVKEGINEFGITATKSIANTPFRAVGTPALSAVEAVTDKKNLSFKTPFGKVESFGTQAERQRQKLLASGQSPVQAAINAPMLPGLGVIGDWIATAQGAKALGGLLPKNAPHLETSKEFKQITDVMLKHRQEHPELYRGGTNDLAFQRHEDVAEKFLTKQLGRDLTQAEQDIKFAAIKKLQGEYFPDSLLGKLYNLEKSGVPHEQAIKQVALGNKGGVGTKAVIGTGLAGAAVIAAMKIASTILKGNEYTTFENAINEATSVDQVFGLQIKLQQFTNVDEVEKLQQLLSDKYKELK